MPKFRKRPVVVVARQVTDENMAELATWCGGKHWTVEGPPAVIVRTLEGAMTAKRGDWIIEGIKGEFYPCKPDIFEMTYEPYEEGA